MLFEGNLRIMGRNILLKFFGRTTYNKESLLSREDMKKWKNCK
jgi:hypothetical protein